MSAKPENLRDFRALLDETIALVENNSGMPLPQTVQTDEPLPSLLEQCETVLQRLETRPAEPLRSIHHFACSGGTLISKCIAASPNVYFFSEIDPLSTHHFSGHKRPFFPTDLLVDLHYSPRPVDDALKLEFFQAGLEKLHRDLSAVGQHIVIRDHPHSHFCRGSSVPGRPNLRQILSRIAPVRSVVTVRHPLDSFLSLSANKWLHFSPATLEEYCQRYALFLKAYRDQPLFRYEDFLEDAPGVLQNILDALALEPAPDFSQLRPLFHFSGDSGRNTPRIEPRPRRDIPDALQHDKDTSPAYAELCQTLGYDP